MRPFIKFWLLILLPSVAYGCLGRNPIKHDDSSGSSNGGPKSTYNDWLQDLYSEYKPGMYLFFTFTLMCKFFIPGKSVVSLLN